MNLKKIKPFLISLSLLPALVLAVEIQPPLAYDTLQELVEHIANLIFTIGLVVVPLVILIGAFYVMTAGGEPKRLETGRKLIVYAVIGLAIMLFSKALVYSLRYMMGVPSTP
jgi:hypothetical protein